MIYNAQVPLGPTAETPSDARKTLSEAVELLNKAVARDPNFFFPYCQLAFTHELIGNSPDRLPLAQSAIDRALRLRRDLGDAHLALACYLFLGYSDHIGARCEV